MTFKNSILLTLMRRLMGNAVMKFIIVYARLKIERKKTDWKRKGEEGKKRVAGCKAPFAEFRSHMKLRKFRISQSFFEKFKEM